MSSSPTPQGQLKDAVIYIASHIGEPIRLRDLADSAGVSKRTIGYLFVQNYGTTPMAFIKGIRLAEARRLLMRARSANTTVASIARNCGFRHMGQFARDYRKAFGELPSTTLDRKPSTRARNGKMADASANGAPPRYRHWRRK